MSYPYSPEWKKISKLKMELANNICEDCGKKAQHVHHIDETTHNDSMDNLKALCCKCHNVYHPVTNRPSRYGFYRDADLGEALRRARKDKALRMIDVQDKTGISTATLTSIETGKNTNFKLQTLLKLSDLYGKNVVITLEDK